MNFVRQTARTLHEEHQVNLALLARVEQVFGPSFQAGRDNGEAGRLAGTLAHALEGEVNRHFGFEERELFERMTEAGGGDLAQLLGEEHVSIRAVAAELIPRARAAAAGALDTAGWEALRRNALELVERLTAHIGKEDMAMLPLVDDMLDEDTDRELAMAYACA